MGFFDFVKAVGHQVLPGGKTYSSYYRDKKRKDEEQQQLQQQRQMQSSQAPGLRVTSSQPSQNITTNQPKPQRPENLFAGLNQNLKVGTVPNNQRLVVPKPTPEQEIEQLTANELPKAIEEEKARTSWFDRQFTDRNWNKRAEMAARSRATRQYQEKYGYNKQPEVMGSLDRNRRVGEDLSKGSASQWLAPVISAGRVGTGIAEGAGGLYDILTPGKGQNRLTQGATRKAQEQDQLAKELGVDKLYRTVNVPLEVASYFTPGVVSKGGKVSQLLGKASTKADDVLKIGSKLPRTRRIVSEAIQEFLNPRNLEKELELTSRYMGQDSAKGRPITPKIIAENVAQSAGGAFLSPLFRGLGRVIRRGRGEDFIDEAIDATVSATGTGVSQADNIRRIPVSQNIPVDEVIDEATNVPVQVRTPSKPLIQDVSGGATMSTTNPAIRDVAADIRRQTAQDAFQASARPTNVVDDVTPRAPQAPFSLDPKVAANTQDKLVDDYAALLRDLGEGNGVAITPDGRRVSNNARFGDTKGKRMSKADWRDEAERQLRSGEGEPEIQKAFDEASDPNVQSLLAKGEQPETPLGSPIKVKEATGIPVRDETVVPTDLPETPGEVRVTEATAPSNAKSAAVAAQSPSTILPKEVQEILDNPKQFNKRQVAAARNQRKMARAVAKAQEETAEALDRIETASPAAQSGEGFAPTGEFGKSVKGGAYQKASRAAEMQQAMEETANLSPADVVQTARKTQEQVGAFSRRDIRNIAALFESKRIPRGTPEWEAARQILKEDGTAWGQIGALRNYTMRRTASATELINRFESKIYRLADDPAKIDSKIFDEVEAVEEVYTQARDDALAAYNRFTEAPTSANAKLYHAAQDAAEKADKAAKITEYKAANKVLKGNKDVKQMRELEKMANDADLYQMDAVDASMLSGTGTFVRNLVNAAVGGTEEGLFGGIASRASRLLTGQKVGGGFGKGTVKGFGEGVENIVDASKARASNAGKNPLSHIKNWATTGNQLGDTIIDSQAKHNTLDHYTQILKDQGYKGRELRDRASVMARQDPDDLSRVYTNTARTAAGLGGGITRNNKIETIVKNMISDAISMGNPGRASEATAKLITRMTIGFPTAIGRSTAEGVKRFTLGAPTFIKAIATKDPQMRAIYVKEAIKQAGSGTLVLPPLFYALGSSGMITGAYPTDPEERARWERDGITENSIKIGGAYYQLPGYLGAWAVPGLFYASLGRNEGDWGAAAADTAKAVPAILPTDNITNWLDVINGRSDPGKFAAQTGASAVRAVTPGGALLNQIAKSLDPTKNDTTSGTNWENFIDKVITGIPGQNKFADIPDKVDDAGNVIKNPNPVELLAGAASAVQTEGEERSAQIQANVDTRLQGLADLGVLGDPNLEAILDDKERAILTKLQSGKKIGEGDLEKLQDAFTKGVSQTGDDTAYLEREQYDTNLAVLKLKKKRMEEDKTVKPSDLKKVETAIKRGEIYRDREVPYELISDYQSIGVEEWRKMGDPEEDEYDPEMYQKLWDIDQAMTKAGVSYRKGALDKNKYFLKEKKVGGRGRGGRRSIDTSFGMLKNGTFSPRVQQYESIDSQSGTVPIIRTVRPNIVHKITSSG